jgi:uncharacterized protein YaaR (DUF327 family)
MAIFLGVHEFGERLTQEKMDENWAKYSNSCKEHGAQAHKVHYGSRIGRRSERSPQCCGAAHQTAF